MCGIIGYKGNNNGLDKIINSLEKLEYRGYDSSGICYVKDNNLIINKEIGRIENLKKVINFSDQVSIGIAHTRWATHGAVTKDNAHPHKQGKITIVHNGIIENYDKLKEFLIKQNYIFKSETDTEVACGLINYLYNKSNNMKEAILEFQNMVDGSYAILILNDDNLDTMYALKKDSPLIIAEGENEYFIVSDVPAIIDYTNKYYVLDDYDFCIINKDLNFYDRLGNKIYKELEIYDSLNVDSSKGNYEHYMLKEINEQSLVIDSLINYYTSNNYKNIKDDIPDFKNFDKIKIIACGSAMNAGLYVKYMFERYLNIETDVYLASEFRYKNNFLNNKVLTIFISQSGETADTLQALKIAKDSGSVTLAIVNVYLSSIARNADYVLYTRAGSEIAVATTKGYTSQIMVLSILISMLSSNSVDLYLGSKINKMINYNYSDIVKEIINVNDLYFIGRLEDYALCLEGSLKLKEISYIHSDSYSAGELKHGTISLIEKDTIVISIITNKDIMYKTISNIKEVKARGAKVILIIKESLYEENEYSDYVIKIPDSDDLYMGILSIIPCQLIAYYVAKSRNCDIDKPKNLAKSVTVE